MTAYEIKLTASHENTMVLLDPDCDTFRATTETIVDVSNTVVTKCNALLMSHHKNIDKLTANIYEVTDKGNRIFIGYMYYYDKNFHVPVVTTLPEAQLYKLVYPKKLNMDMGYRMTYINTEGKAVDYTHMYDDKTVIVFYNKKSNNRAAVDEIIRHLKDNGESIKYEPHNLKSLRVGKCKYGRLVGNGGFIFAMGQRMYDVLWYKIIGDPDLKPRFVP